MAIDTTKVENRRHLHFETIANIQSDVERLNQGKFKALGNWSGGQILKHLSIVMNGSIDGAGMRLSWPWRPHRRDKPGGSLGERLTRRTNA